MAAAEESRQTFAQSCADFLKTYPQFDGIDIDWEHPVSGGLQPGSPRDARNYVTLLAALRKAIGPDKLLTVAASASPRGIDPIEYADMAGILDWVSVMTYDFHTGGTRTGFNSALYNHDDPSNPRLNLHDAVQAIAAKGMPRSKLVAGVPFYGRGWRGVESSAAWSTGTGSLQVGGYRTLAETFLKSPDYDRYWDDVAKVPWLYNAARRSGSPTKIHNRCGSRASTSWLRTWVGRCSGNCQTTTGPCSMRCAAVWAWPRRGPASDLIGPLEGMHPEIYSVRVANKRRN